MDHTEDLSPRVLLKHILSTEPPRTPLTRSSSKMQSTRETRSSKKNAVAQTPQDILRRSLKQKMRESIIRKSASATRRRATSSVHGKTQTPASASVVFDDGDTPRHLLRNILQTEPLKCPVVHEKAASEEPQPPAARSSLTSKRLSIELSSLDLPDLTIGNAASSVKGLSRKRPRRSFNVTAFEKHLKDAEEEKEESIGNGSSLSLSSSTSLTLNTPFVGGGTEKRGLQRRVTNRQKITEDEFDAAVIRRQMGEAEEKNEESIDDCSSLSLSNSTSLSLKTPFVNVRTEKRGLQRRVPNYRRITEEEFGAAVTRRQMGSDHGVSSSAAEKQGPSQTTYSEDFTLGLSKLSEPDITIDVINCNTALYAHPDAMTSHFSIAATQDKFTVLASQLQRELEAEQSKLGKEKSVYVFPSEQDALAEPKKDKCFSQSEENADAAESEEEEEEGQSTADGRSAAHSQTEEKDLTRSQSEKEEGAAEPQTEEDEGAFDSLPKNDVDPMSQSKEKEGAPEENVVESQSEKDDEAMSQSEEEGDAEQCQSDGEVPPASSQSEELRDVAESQEEQDEEEEEGDQAIKPLEHVSRRSHRSEGALIMPVTETGGDVGDATEAGWSDSRSKSHSTTYLHSSQPHLEIPDLAETSSQGQKDASCTETKLDADKEKINILGVTHDIEASSPMSDALPEEAAGQEEEWSSEDDEEELPCKTPAFVREKQNFFHNDPLASPCFPKNIQASGTSKGKALPAAKPKQVRPKRGPAKKEAGFPKSYLMGVFKHFAKTKVSADVYPVLKEIMDKFFDRLVEDLETYANHAKRKTIEVEDAELLLKRQGYVNEKVPVEVLIEKYLRMEQRKLLIPIATSGNAVFPKLRR
ncbi:centromere protein T isoform X2 [Mastacembelus armatus]|uniref:centromere protein T isoform X2 n=1 Tax=Mastacembelus armatus TaxID=205130 RepID=UPI000E4616DD|nr:centromere protein T isoform X2 [Mastacembelus armatus]